MKWVAISLGVIFGPLIFTSVMVGYLAQAWAPWWIGQRQLDASRPVALGDLPIILPAQVPVPGAPRLEGIVDVARSWLGTRYVWGGCTRHGIDCSCLVRNVLMVFGINAPRTTTEQIRWATPISRDQIAVGDLVFYDNTCSSCGADPTHVGVYIGGGQIIHAGDPVQISPAFTGYFGLHNPRVGRPR